MPKRKTKQGPESYLEPDFIRELLKKAAEYLIGAASARTGHITQDPLFEAIAYVRLRGWAEQKLFHDFAAAEDKEFKRFSIHDSLVSNKLTPKGLIDIRDDQLGPKDHKHEELLAHEFIAAVRRGDTDLRNKIGEFCDRLEWAIKDQSDPLPWEYYAARAALGFLVKNRIPFKKEVKAAAFRERAIAELPVMYRVGTEELLPMLQEAGEPKEMRMIDPEPAPDQDPESYYGADQGEDDPSAEMPAKNDVSSPQPPRTAGEEKPALARQREKLIAKRIEELQRLHTSKVWAATWARAFKHLGLKDLPRC